MKLYVVRSNIERFRRLLNETSDIAKRRVVEKLLQEEEAKPHEDSPAKRGNSSTGQK